MNERIKLQGAKALTLICVALTAIVFNANHKASADDRTTVSFNRDIRPIFSDTCFRCHGPDKNARMVELRLDIREEATKKTKSGVIPIVPGKPEESEIIRRIFSNDEYELMPPKESHKSLSQRQKETIKRWVAEGAKYEGHWAYKAVSRPAIPEVSKSVAPVRNQPVRNPIDAFIQERLTREGLQASPEADRRTLIRRVSLDLTGLPPTPQEVAAFLNDRSPDAYEKVVDRLLASPRYAEKQAMHWLDAVRYADTAGFHGDNELPAWPYRDYVLRAFRDNKPFDEFTREQIAGDLLMSVTPAPLIASAYNRMNRTSAEGGLQPKEYLAKYAADRVRTTSSVWLGVTIGCAECHDHKFDPILTRDFYSMKAFFADIKETGLVPDRGRNAFGSKLAMPTEQQKNRSDELGRQIAWLKSELDDQAQQLTLRHPEWEKQILRSHEAGKLAWRFQRPLSAKSERGTTLKIYNDEPLVVTVYRGGSLLTEQINGDGLVVASGANPDNETYTVTFKPGAGRWTALGIEVVQDESLPANRLSRGADRFELTEVEAELGQGDGGTGGQRDRGTGRQRDRETGRQRDEEAKQAANSPSVPRSLRPSISPSSRIPLPFVLATTDGVGQHPENHAMNVIDGAPQTGWGNAFADGRGAFIALRFARKLETTEDSIVTVRLRHDSELRRATIGRFRLALSSAEHSWPDHLAKTSRPMNGVSDDVLRALREPEEKRSQAQRKALLEFFKWSWPELEPMVARLAKLEAEFDLLDSQIPRVVVTEATIPMETRVLPRGNFLDESGEVVQPAIPAVFGKLDVGNRRATRLDLANWIASKENPLTARVSVNRMWRQFFGTGLSKALDDLGSQGEWPTHPELLDWMAAEFMHPVECGVRNAECGTITHDWDVKHIIRLIVTSHTYRQSSNPESNPQSEDPDNRLLARQSRFRVDAETVRDIALSVSGLLVEKFGGPSVKPYQPAHYLAALNFPVRDYSEDRGEDLYRRGLYTIWQRTFLHPSLMTFDAPSREECAANRSNSNTPLQALVLLNDPIYVEAARVFAENMLKRGGQTVDAQITWAFERALSRVPTLPERRALVELHSKSLAGFQRDPASARDFISAGDSPVAKDVNASRLAAMTTVSRAILNLHETITRN
ncbi:MAG TPA: PSD1 and planctomycete cytochrome C domain-containing protein [Blastocatellia bacterium]|nr:PSD1 and planctomycete cytochrome C domain-containing protein [Blastocatellia bacterium]